MRSALKCALLPALAIVALTGASNIAQAATVTGSFSVSIYQSSGNTGANTAAIKLLANNQADTGNPMLGGGFLIDTGSYLGDIDFLTTGGSSSIGDFLASAGGAPSGFLPGTLTTTLSSSGVGGGATGITTLFVFTGTTAGAIVGGVTHDDGASIWVPSSASYALHAPVPTGAVLDGYSSIAASTLFEIYYVAANGDPEQLQMTSSSNAQIVTPLPATVWLFGSVLAGSGLFVSRRRKRKSATAA